MKKILALVLCAAMCMAMVPAMGEGSVVRIAFGYDPNTLDYGKVNLDVANFILEHTSEALMTQGRYLFSLLVGHEIVLQSERGSSHYPLEGNAHLERKKKTKK